MAALTDLSRFRVDGSAEVTMPRPCVPADPDALTIAFDQSLAATGVALMQGASVIAFDTLKTEPIATSHEDTVARSVVLFHRITDWAYENLLDMRGAVDAVAVEYPAVATPRMRRTESSLVAATAVAMWADANGHPHPTFVSAQKARKRFVGKSGATKAEVNAAVRRLSPDLTKINQSVSDAIILGWLAAEEGSST